MAVNSCLKPHASLEAREYTSVQHYSYDHIAPQFYKEHYKTIKVYVC